MWRDRIRELLSISRRRRPRTEEPPEATRAVSPSVKLPKEPAGITVHVEPLRLDRTPKASGQGADVFDYLLGFIIIALLVLGGSLWTSGDKVQPNTGPHTLSPPPWLRRNSAPLGEYTGGSAKSPSRRPQSPKGSDGASDETPLAEKPPVPVEVVPASYTEEARNAQFHGKVYVTVFVDALGMPQKIEPTSPIPFGLEDPIREAVLQWRFDPAYSATGDAIASKTVIEVPFR